MSPGRTPTPRERRDKLMQQVSKGKGLNPHQSQHNGPLMRNPPLQINESRLLKDRLMASMTSSFSNKIALF
jgi:hypothetical protein